MEEQKKSNPNDFSEEFMPVLQRYRKTAISSLLFVVLLLFIGMGFKTAIIVFLFIGALIFFMIWNMFMQYKIRCPNCNAPYPLGDRWISPLFPSRCPSCSVILIKEVSWSEKTTCEKTRIVTILMAMVMLMVLAIVVGIIRGGGIKYQHYDVSKSQCR